MADVACRSDREIDALHEYGAMPHVHGGHLLLGASVDTQNRPPMDT